LVFCPILYRLSLQSLPLWFTIFTALVRNLQLLGFENYIFAVLAYVFCFLVLLNYFFWQKNLLNMSCKDYKNKKLSTFTKLKTKILEGAKHLINWIENPFSERR